MRGSARSPCSPLTPPPGATLSTGATLSRLPPSSPITPPDVDSPTRDVRLDALLLDPAKIGSVALRRLVEEVRTNRTPPVGFYDRVHNRHNR